MVAIIVGDNKQAAQDLAEHLRTFGEMEVVDTASKGLEGLAMVSQYQPDVIFLDVLLPDISGLDFLDQVRALTHGKCRVVMITASDEFILPAFRKKAFDVLTKPIDEKELAGVLSRLAHEEGLVMHADDNMGKKQSSKYLFYTNTLDFKLIDKRDIGLFQYNHSQRCWEVVVAGSKQPIKLKRNLKSDTLMDLSDQFAQVNQKFIVNLNYLIEVVDNVCHFYPPFDKLDYVKVSRIYRRKLIDRFLTL